MIWTKTSLIAGTSLMDNQQLGSIMNRVQRLSKADLEWGQSKLKQVEYSQAVGCYVEWRNNNSFKWKQEDLITVDHSVRI